MPRRHLGQHLADQRSAAGHLAIVGAGLVDGNVVISARNAPCSVEHRGHIAKFGEPAQQPHRRSIRPSVCLLARGYILPLLARQCVTVEVPLKTGINSMLLMLILPLTRRSDQRKGAAAPAAV